MLFIILFCMFSAYAAEDQFSADNQFQLLPRCYKMRCPDVGQSKGAQQYAAYGYKDGIFHLDTQTGQWVAALFMASDHNSIQRAMHAVVSFDLHDRSDITFSNNNQPTFCLAQNVSTSPKLNYMQWEVSNNNMRNHILQETQSTNKKIRCALIRGELRSDTVLLYGRKDTLYRKKSMLYFGWPDEQGEQQIPAECTGMRDELANMQCVDSALSGEPAKKPGDYIGLAIDLLSLIYRSEAQDTSEEDVIDSDNTCQCAIS